MDLEFPLGGERWDTNQINHLPPQFIAFMREANSLLVIAQTIE